MSSAQLESRLTRLEEHLYFVEEELQGLNRVVTAQQERIDALERDKRQLQSRLKEALDLLESSYAPQNGTPPHHVARLW